jgi:hypothetical protein
VSLPWPALQSGENNYDDLHRFEAIGDCQLAAANDKKSLRDRLTLPRHDHGYSRL